MPAVVRVSQLAVVLLLAATLACKKAPAASATSTAPPAGAEMGAEPVKPVPAVLPDVLATVNGESITKAEFEAAVSQVEQQNGGPVPAEQRDQLYRGVLEQIVGLKLLAQEAKARNVAVADTDVDAAIANIRGQFPSEEVFTQALQAQKKTLDDLKIDARRDLAITRMLDAALAEKVAVTAEQTKTFYDQNQERFQQPERVKASHILIRIPEGADAVTKESARKRAQDVLAQVKAGKDFAALAKQHSEDPGSAVQGGDLGFFQKGQMVPQFDEAAFALAAGATTDLVETQFGFHIIRVVEKQAPRTVPLDEIKPRLEAFLLNQNKQKETRDFVAALRSKGKVEILV